MEGFLSLILSPIGVGLYVLFWIFKLTAGAWVVRKIILILPMTTKQWLSDNIRLPGIGVSAVIPGIRDMK